MKNMEHTGNVSTWLFAFDVADGGQWINGEYRRRHTIAVAWHRNPGGDRGRGDQLVELVVNGVSRFLSDSEMSRLESFPLSAAKAKTIAVAEAARLELCGKD